MALAGEELTFDYGAVTTSETEYRMAVCLCGTMFCRQSFLHFVAADNTRYLLDRWHSPVQRFSFLFDACVRVPNDSNRKYTQEVLFPCLTPASTHCGANFHLT